MQAGFIGHIGYYKKVLFLYDWFTWEGSVSRKNPGNKKNGRGNQAVTPATTVASSGIRPWFDKNINILQGIGVIIIVAGMIAGGIWWVFSVSSYLNQIQGSVSKLETKSEDGLTRITKVEALLSVLGKQVFPKAFELGFTDPQFIPLQLMNSSQMKIAQPVSSGFGYRFTFTVQEVGKDYITLRVDGYVDRQEGKNSGITVTNSFVKISTRDGEPVNLWEVLKRASMFPMNLDPPPLWLAIVDLPTPSTAIVAVGARKV